MKMLLKVLGVFLLLALIGGNPVVGVPVALGVIAYIIYNKKNPKTQIAATKELIKPIANIKRSKISFNVTGITKPNDKGENPQQNIKEFVKQYIEMNGYSYMDMTNKEILEHGEDVYEVDIYGSDDISFKQEPDNPFDPSAIKVIHDEIGHVGYVPKDLTKKVWNIVSSEHDIEWKLVGGKFKYIDYEEDKVKTKTNTYGISIELLY